MVNGQISSLSQRFGKCDFALPLQLTQPFVDLVLILSGQQVAIKLVIDPLHLFIIREAVVIVLGHQALAFGDQLIAERRARIRRVKRNRREHALHVFDHAHRLEGIFRRFARNAEHDVRPERRRDLALRFHFIADFIQQINGEVVILFRTFFVPVAGHGHCRIQIQSKSCASWFL